MAKGQRGGSLASTYVNGLLKKRCSLTKTYRNNKELGNLSSVNLYKVTGGGYYSKNRFKGGMGCSGKKKSKPKRKPSSKKRKSRRKTKRRQRGGYSDWITTFRSRGPVNNPSTYDKNLLRQFTKSGKYMSKDELSPLYFHKGSGRHRKTKRKSQKKSSSLNNHHELKKSIRGLQKDVRNTPKRLSKAAKQELAEAAVDVTKSARRNLNQLNKELEEVLKQEIKKSNIRAKRQLRKGSQNARKTGQKLRNKMN